MHAGLQPLFAHPAAPSCGGTSPSYPEHICAGSAADEEGHPVLVENGVVAGKVSMLTAGEFWGAVPSGGDIVVEFGEGWMELPLEGALP